MPKPEGHSSTAEIFDPDVLRSYVGDDVAAANAILGQYIDATRADFANLTTAIGLGSAQDVFQASHRIKSASKMLGCAVMSAIAGKLEQAGREGNWTEIPTLNHQLEATLADTLACIDMHLASQGDA